MTAKKAMENIRLSDSGNSLIIVDQTLLPNELKYIKLSSLDELAEAIKKLRVRGAPAIGIFAGYAMYITALHHKNDALPDFFDALDTAAGRLISTRPTAVNLKWAVRRVKQAAKAAANDVNAVLCAMAKECAAIHNEDITMCKAISEYGLSLIKDGDTILTHCNAGPLATSHYGTALGPLLLGRERGMNFHVYADETRPLLQGARLTSYELYNAGIDVTLICDNMAGMVMKQGLINACFVGCDRVAANGDAANKIGTSSVAILAKYYGVPFYVLGPTSTIDLNTKTGDDIEIELRDPSEIKTMHYAKPMAPEGVKCYNPSFDVTDNSLITAIITEKGIIRPPFSDKLKKLFD